MTKLIKMKREDGHVADVHPEMVEDYRKGGYVPMGADDGLQEEKAEAVTPETIDAMDGPDLTQWLREHGVESVPRALEDRRDMLKRVMFVDM